MYKLKGFILSGLDGPTLWGSAWPGLVNLKPCPQATQPIGCPACAGFYSRVLVDNNCANVLFVINFKALVNAQT